MHTTRIYYNFCQFLTQCGSFNKFKAEGIVNYIRFKSIHVSTSDKIRLAMFDKFSKLLRKTLSNLRSIHYSLHKTKIQIIRLTDSITILHKMAC